MSLGKSAILTIVAMLSVLGAASGVTLVQTGGTFIAFNAELGTLDDDPSNGSKFDVMAPAGGSFDDYLSVESTPASVSYDVDFLDDNVYTVYVRYRELGGGSPTFNLTFEGTTTPTTVFVAASTSFGWVHLSHLDFTPSGTTPGLSQTVTLTATNSTTSDYDIDAVAFVSRLALTTGSFTVSDATIPESALTIPEPSSALLLLTGQLLLLFRRRR